MAIKVQTLLTQKARKFGASENSLDFQQIVLDCLNYVLDDIDNRLELSTAEVTGIGDTIDLSSQTYRPLISLGLDYYISNQGEWTTGNVVGIKAQFEQKLKRIHMKYLKTLDLSAKFGDLDYV